MYVKKIYIAVWAINFALVGMVGYVWGTYNGFQEGRLMSHSVDRTAIEYAVYQAIKGE